MSFLLEIAWVTQASDFLTQNWTKLLGILGGSGGAIALLTVLGKIILAVIKGRIERKNGAPTHALIAQTKQELSNAIEKYNQSILNMQEQIKIELKQFIKETLEKAQKVKIALYDKLVDEGKNAEQALEDINNQIKKLEEYKDQLEQEKIDEYVDTTVEDEQEIAQISEEEGYVIVQKSYGE